MPTQYQVNRSYRNSIAKEARQLARQAALVALGKRIAEAEKAAEQMEKPSDFFYDIALGLKTEPTPRSTNRLAWLGGKEYAQQGDSRKNRSGHLPEHTAAIPENASRMFAIAVDKALTPTEVSDENIA